MLSPSFSSPFPPQERQKAFSSYKDYLGKDITSLVILPVWIMQPFTMLQNMTEIMEYASALDRAADTKDPYERLAWVAGFTMGPFGAVERPWKPFNPILGETFEYYDDELGVKFIAEQVSHHPPIGASHAENGKWTYGLVSAPRTKFLGNSVEVYPVGRTRIELKTTGETFSLVPPTSKANNVIIGSTWIDTYGEYALINTTTGARAVMEFTECGWFGRGRYEIAGYVYREDGSKALYLEGRWNEYLDYAPCDDEGNPVPDAPATRVWQCAPKPEDDAYSFTHFANALNSSEGVVPLPSDSRRRPDRACLADGDSGTAAVAKFNLEQMQRAERKERAAKGDSWQPRWFRALPKGEGQVLENEYDDDECPQFEFVGDMGKLSRGEPKDAAEVHGKGFSPWCYPSVHPELGKETERH